MTGQAHDGWDAYQADLVVLLVGSNPLPNAVAGHLLVRPNGLVCLLGTPTVTHIVRKLDAWLHRRRPDVARSLQEIGDEADAAAIFRAVRTIVQTVLDPETERDGNQGLRDWVRNRPPSSGTLTIGLCYTGGTKAMAVHAYRAVEQTLARNRWPEALVATYVDARQLAVRRDSADPLTGTMSTMKRVTPKDCTLSLQELFYLHGREISPHAAVLSLEKTVQALLQIHADSDLSKGWTTWLNQVVYPAVFCESKGWEPLRWKKWRELEQAGLLSLPLPEAERVRDLIIKADEIVQDGQFNFSLLASRLGFEDRKRKLVQSVKWLEGGWLEHFVFKVLQDLQPGLNLVDVETDVRVAADSRFPDFQLDVVTMRGYQLFVFSCSTSTEKGLVKQKIFEAVLRARQLGGDEARVAVVCCSKEPDLRDELNDLFRQGGQLELIKVFMRDDLLSLPDKVCAWIASEGNQTELAR